MRSRTSAPKSIRIIAISEFRMAASYIQDAAWPFGLLFILSYKAGQVDHGLEILHIAQVELALHECCLSPT